MTSICICLHSLNLISTCRYSLDLSDLQVMVGKPRDNWKHVKGRGITHLHLVDKFSINLHFER